MVFLTIPTQYLLFFISLIVAFQPNLHENQELITKLSFFNHAHIDISYLIIKVFVKSFWFWNWPFLPPRKNVIIETTIKDTDSWSLHIISFISYIGNIKYPPITDRICWSLDSRYCGVQLCIWNSLTWNVINVSLDTSSVISLLLAEYKMKTNHKLGNWDKSNFSHTDSLLPLQFLFHILCNQNLHVPSTTQRLADSIGMHYLGKNKVSPTRKKTFGQVWRNISWEKSSLDT